MAITKSKKATESTKPSGKEFTGGVSNTDFVNSLKSRTTIDLGDNKGDKKDKVATSTNQAIKKEISSPLKDMSNFFSGIDNSLIKLVDFAKQSFGFEKTQLGAILAKQKYDEEVKKIQESNLDENKKKNKLKTLKDDFEGVDTDKDKKKESKNVLGGMLKSLKDSFQEVEFGEKMTALLMIGGLAIFLKYKDQIVAALTPLVSFFKGVVDILGVEGTLMLLFGSILLIKLAPVITAAFAIGKYLGGFLPSFKTLKRAFRLMRVFIRRTLPRQLASTYNKGAFLKGFTLLGGAFKALRLMLTASLYPAIMTMVRTLATALGPILGPLVVIAAIAAAIAAVLFSIKSGFETFKNSLADGDSMLVAIGKGIADFALTLYTLPLTLIKKLVGFIAGLFGFEGIKESLDKFSFKDFIKNSFMSLIKNFAKVIKAIAFAAGAALAAIAPGGKTPQAEFGRVFNEIMTGGAGQSKVEKTEIDTNTEGQPELTERQVKDSIQKERSQVEAQARSELSFFEKLYKGDRFIEGSEAFDSAAKFKNDKNLRKQEKISTMELKKQELNDMIMKKENDSRARAKAQIVSIDASKTGDVTAVNNQNNITGDLEVNNTESIQRFMNAVGNGFNR